MDNKPSIILTFNKALSFLVTSVFAGQQQRRSAMFIHDVDVRTVFNQQPNHVGVALVDSSM